MTLHRPECIKKATPTASSYFADKIVVHKLKLQDRVGRPHTFNFFRLSCILVTEEKNDCIKNVLQYIRKNKLHNFPIPKTRKKQF